MSWYDNFFEILNKKDTLVIPTCSKCNNTLSYLTLDHYNICEHCGEYQRLTVEERINLLIDENTFEEYNREMESKDILNFEDVKKYKNRLKHYTKETGCNSAVLTGSCRISGIPVELVIMNFEFMGGSLGAVEGEKITLAIEKAIEKKSGVLIVSSSGGARMQENVYSLLQMSKTSAALKRLSNKKLPYISLLTNPTMGGVSASFAFLGDVIISEPGAIIGFAGRRVIEQTIKTTLPEGFQTAEFLLEHGLIDSIIKREYLNKEIGKLFKLFSKNTNKEKQ